MGLDGLVGVAGSYAEMAARGEAPRGGDYAPPFVNALIAIALLNEAGDYAGAAQVYIPKLGRD